jgi:hypothetical protein
MFTNRVWLIISIVAVAAVVLVALFWGRKSRELSPLIHAVPTDAALILETRDFGYLTSKILKNEFIQPILSKASGTRELYKHLQLIDSLLITNEKIKHFLSDNTVIVSIHASGPKDFETLITASSRDNKENLNNLNEIISGLNKAYKKSEESFDGSVITKQENETTGFYYSFYEDYFLFSQSEIVIQKAVKNINGGVSLFDNENFKTLYSLVNTKNDAELYVNYDHFSHITDLYTNKSGLDLGKLIHTFADWSVFDLNIQKDEIELSGHTTLKSEMQYLSMFKSFNPGKSNILKIMPEKTSFFVSFNIQSGRDFQYQFEDYLAQIKDLNDKQIELAAFHNTCKIDPDKSGLYELTDNEIGLVFEDINKNGKQHHAFIFIKIKDKALTESFLLNVSSEFSKADNLSFDDYNQAVFANEDYYVKKIPVKNIPQIYYGNIFENISSEYYTFIEDYLIFGETVGALTGLLDSYLKDKTFRRKSPDYKYPGSLSDESNILLYINIFNSQNTIKQNLTEKKSEKFSKDIDLFTSIKGPSIQFISDSYPIYSVIKIHFNTDRKEISETVWEVKLDSLIATKPYIIQNHTSKEKEIIIQDIANKLYLIDKNGNILWTRQLEDKIMGKIYQIDYFKNEKLQLLFNTKNKIHCIDRNGNWVEGFPKPFKSEASCGLTLIDYDKDKNYRVFIPAKNNMIYLYDKDVNLIQGWEFKTTSSNVSKEIEVYQFNETDYVTFRDNSSFYILNRRGQKRVFPEVEIPVSKNNEIFFTPDNSKDKAHFTMTGTSGTLYILYPDGKVINKTFDTFSNNHLFTYEDINGDQIPDYIFTDNNRTTVFDGANDKKILSYKYEDDIVYPPVIYKFSDTDIRIGAGSKNKIWLINNEGKLCKGFPLVGTGMFSITLFDASDEFSLVVGNNDNYLYKYVIK